MFSKISNSKNNAPKNLVKQSKWQRFRDRLSLKDRDIEVNTDNMGLEGVYRQEFIIDSIRVDLQEIYNQALKAEEFTQIKQSLEDFLQVITDAYPKTFTKEGRDDNYKKFVGICSRYVAIINKETQEKKLNLKYDDNQADDLSAIFSLAYRQVSPRKWLSSMDMTYKLVLLRPFLNIGNNPKGAFIYEDCLSIMVDTDKYAEELECEKERITKKHEAEKLTRGLVSRNSKQMKKKEIDEINTEIARLKVKKREEKSQLRSDEYFLVDIFKNEIELTRGKLYKRLSRYAKEKSYDFELIIDEIMAFSTPLLEKTSEDPKKELEIFCKIITEGVEIKCNK